MNNLSNRVSSVLVPRQRNQNLALNNACDGLNKVEADSIILISKRKLLNAQSYARENQSRYGWEVANHLLKLAYGIKCECPMPRLGDSRGNYICTFVDISTGEYRFEHSRAIANVREVNHGA
ncbi:MULTISPECIES: hypothetical protein [Yersinia]|uniref:Uncharacterized protein n=3 Tax=Yersinia TaxID=629 RepID=A0AAI8ZR51_YERFR|nr:MULTISPECIES: hypothetical protein [Yersinia]ATM87032.1 hypothetical protein CRN74_13670 [Yersinia frederiksenii]CFR04385.1 Uncharacterised protein [Yersinia frederiksenii]CNK57278.1 Uncharacterised protein [Yersinia frederiksenii]CQH53098.1 Uncharacterised protein [Yersinia frederiksenii]